MLSTAVVQARRDGDFNPSWTHGSPMLYGHKALHPDPHQCCIHLRGGLVAKFCSERPQVLVTTAEDNTSK